MLGSHKDEDIALSIAVGVLEMVKKEQDLDVAFRLVVALGTLIFEYPTTKQLFSALDGKETVTRFASSSDTKLSTATNALLQLTK